MRTVRAEEVPADRTAIIRFISHTVAMRFNPPPNWPPVPPDWTPPAGWQPDPSWPPPPPGWPLWVQDNRSGRRTGLILGAVAVVLLIVIGAVVTVAVTRHASSTVPSAAPTTTAQPTDEEQIEK